MTVDFWGVRGSIASPGAATVRYGGNTPCVAIAVDDARILVLDAGTGIRRLGQWLETTDHEIFVAISHRHRDHVEGFPFFSPIFQADRPIHLLPNPSVDDGWSLLRLFDGVHSAVGRDDLRARISCDGPEGWARLERGGLRVTMVANNHPGGATGYRVESSRGSVVYMTDSELDPPYQATTPHGALVEFCRSADVLIHDAMYRPAELEQRRGWGHGSVEQACDLACEADARHLVLFHHDPDRTDDELDAIGDHALERARRDRPAIRVTVAFEGLSLEL